MIVSILNSVKKVLDIEPEYEEFDEPILMHINSVFVDLQQLGVGPEEGFEIEDATPEWATFVGAQGVLLNNVKSYTCLRVKQMFDPPSTSFHLDALQRQIDKYEWRINVRREEYAWVDPNQSLDTDDDELDLVLDGGGA